MTTTPVGNDTGGPGTGEGEDEGVDPLVIGLAAGLGGAALLAAAGGSLFFGLRRRRRLRTTTGEQKPRDDGRPQKSIAFFQAVGAARPANLSYLMQNDRKGKKQAWVSAQNASRVGASFRPQMSGHRPVSIDNRLYDLYCNSAGTGACFSAYDRPMQRGGVY